MASSTKELVLTAVRQLQADNLLGKIRSETSDNYTMSCPFTHNHGGKKEQRTPSFGIHKTKGVWNCFSCGEKGSSVYTLFSRLKGITTGEATYTLGTPKEDPNSVLEALQALKSGSLVPGLMTGMPTTIPLDKSPAALDYMVRRGIPKDLLEKCSIKYHVREFMPDKIGGEPSGVRGHRIIFDVYHNGAYVGYSARTMGDDKPKYYRPIRHVNQTLYDPTNVLTTAHTDYVVVCEGEISALAAIREGLPAVCSFGASLSRAQMGLLARFNTIFILFDGDEAGEKGIRNAVDSYGSFANIKPIILPSGKDPASMSAGWGTKVKSKVQSKRPDNRLDKLESLLHTAG